MKSRFSFLPLVAAVLAVLVSLPVASVVVNIFQPDKEDVWAHLAETVLAEYVFNSLALAVGAGLGAALLGTGAAWIVAMYRFPGRRLMEWALLLPLAMPTYVIAYAYTDFLQFAGPVQTTLREAFGWTRDDYWFPEVRSLEGAVLIFSLVFYPYVYVLARTAFLERSGVLMEAARSLGYSQRAAFFRVALPLARPAVAGGVALVIMESLAEFGAVAYFGVPTFTTGIYRAWYAFGDPVAASQLAASLLAVVALALVLEKASRGRARFDDAGGRPSMRPILVGWRAALARPVVLAASTREGEEPPLLAAWRALPAPESLQAMGTEWARLKNSAVLAVPSAVIPAETNYLLNPAHPTFAEIEIGEAQPFITDLRLIKR